jgi:outer membrane protein assembly factor BamB
VLAASAYLETEKTGERALLCLAAADGKLRWKASLKFNPWAGPTVYENKVIVGGSSIRFDPLEIPKGRGEVTALDLANGKVLWQRDVPGGVVSSVAAKKDLAIFTATDGKVRAWNLSTGRTAWTYDAKTPFFAAPAIAGSLAFVADLKGGVHAIQLADGKAAWKLDLAKDAAVKSRGMVYGSPVIAKGRLYVATCNLEGDDASAGSVVVCIGNK